LNSPSSASVALTAITFGSAAGSANSFSPLLPPPPSAPPRSPPAASAKVWGWGWHHHHHRWLGGFGFYGPGFVVAGDCYFPATATSLTGRLPPYSPQGGGLKARFGRALALKREFC